MNWMTNLTKTQTSMRRLKLELNMTSNIIMRDCQPTKMIKIS